MAMTRREMLAGAGKLAPGFALGGAAISARGDDQSAPREQTKRKLKVVVTGGHPGDPEYGCGGTVARFTDRGDDVVLLYMNNGAWPPTPASVRIAEAKKACEILGAHPAYVGQVNGNSIVDNTHYEKFRKLLVAEKPDVVFSQWPIDHHPDHRALSTLVLNAWLKAKKKFALYYYEVGQDTMMFEPQDFVDITDQVSRKREACYAHASQTPDYWYPLEVQLEKFRGIQGGFKRAEGFLRHWESKSIVLP
jgi:LmbE family N-acetylglucosaminyl deacetylase